MVKIKNNLELNNSSLSSLILAGEAERKSMANKIHNDLSSKLNVIALHCKLLNLPDIGDKERKEFSDTITTYANLALESCKQLNWDLLPPTLERFGLAAGLEELFSKTTADHEISINYTNNLDFDYQQNERHILIFRIIQELVVNSIKHGKASKITVRFTKHNEKYNCSYSDNGLGFDLQKLESHKGRGLRNIASRLAIIGGDLSIESQLGKGISVIFNF